MDYIPVAALAVFVATLFLMIKRPRDLGLGYAAGIGAMASLYCAWIQTFLRLKE